MDFKCGWTHCEWGGHISNNQEKVKVGKRWYHKECACERDCINDIITTFQENINENADIKVLRSVINNLIYDECKPAEYVLFSVRHAIAHPEFKLTFPQGIYRVCNHPDVLHAWQVQQNKKFMATVDQSKFVADNVAPTSVINKQKKTGFGTILGKKDN